MVPGPINTPLENCFFFFFFVNLGPFGEVVQGTFEGNGMLLWWYLALTFDLSLKTRHISSVLDTFWCSHCPWREKTSQSSIERPASLRHLARAWKKGPFLSEFHGAPRHVQEFSWCDIWGFVFLCSLGHICWGWGTTVCHAAHVP